MSSGVIRIRGARQQNLESLDLDIQTGELTVVTGPSGSGNGSLVFDTLYAKGQRRYVETFSAYAHLKLLFARAAQFFGQQAALPVRHDTPETIYADQLTRAAADDPRPNFTFPVELPADTTAEQQEQGLAASGLCARWSCRKGRTGALGPHRAAIRPSRRAGVQAQPVGRAARCGTARPARRTPASQNLNANRRPPQWRPPAWIGAAASFMTMN